MEGISEEEEYVFRKLKSMFDNFFDRYCTTLQRGVSTRIFMEDTKTNRVMMGEFRNYLEQRAQVEGWNYKPENFKVTYYPKPIFPPPESFMANPLSDKPNEPVTFQRMDSSDVFIRLSQDNSRKLRNGLLHLVTDQEES
ncbi:hypothetical protein J4221_04900 [Candidatus Pacearchaeota archaeon]|nr:hypothetical protein [Candidatus Pacearchaeota archaeon]